MSPELLLSVYFITATGRETKAGYECYLVAHWVGPSTTEGERKKAKAGGGGAQEQTSNMEGSAEVSTLIVWLWLVRHEEGCPSL